MATAVAEIERQVGDKGPFGRVWNGEKWVKSATPAAPAGLDTAALATLIKDSIAQAVAPLEDKIRDLEAQAPTKQFQKMDPTLGQSFGQPERQATKRFQGDGGEESLPIGS